MLKTRARWMFLAGAIGLINAGVERAVGQTECVPVPYGSFQNAFEGWHVVPLMEFEGNASAGATNSIGDGTALFPPMDEHVAVLQCGAQAAGSKPEQPLVNIATAQISMVSSSFEIEHRYLTFLTGGGFESLRMGSGITTLEFHLTIQGPDDTSIVVPFTHLKPPPFETCDFGMSILGTFAFDEPRAVDLFEHAGKPTGLKVGDSITVEVVLTCEAGATNLCDAADMRAVLFLDDFQMCPVKPGGVPGDVNGDGSVDVDDLLAVINNWGMCGVCPADIARASDPNGVVDVDDLLMVINHWN